MNSNLSLNVALVALSAAVVACGGGEGMARDPNATQAPGAPTPTGQIATPIPTTGVPVATGPGPVVGAPTTATTPTLPSQTIPPAMLGGSLLIVNETGFVDDTLANNPTGTGIIGPWYAYGDPTSLLTLTRPQGATFASPTGAATTPMGQVCLAGQTAAVPTQPDFATIFGVGLGLDLNNTGGSATAAKLTWNAGAHTGFSVNITGTIPSLPGGIPSPDGIRIAFLNPGKGDFAHFVTITTVGVHQVLFNAAAQGVWVAMQNPANVAALDTTQLEAIQFQIPSALNNPVNYDFCVEMLSVL